MNVSAARASFQVRAQWKATIESGCSPEELEVEICSYLDQYPSLEALQDCYGIEATTFWIDGHCAAPYRDPGSGGNLDVCVSIEGEIEGRFAPEVIASWDADQIWEELADYSDLLGFPDRFEIRVGAAGELT